MSNLSELLPAGSSVKSADFVAQGTLASGVTVGLRSDGKVEAIADNSVTEGVGTAALYNNAVIAHSGSAYDATSNKVIIAYQNGANGYYGTAIVGTVSGTTITFGTAVVFLSAQIYNTSVLFDSSNNKIVIVYADANAVGKAVVGTVSGTSISFGSAVTFKAATIEYVSATFDSTLNKIIIAFKDSSNSGYGTGIVGTVSGTSISFGSVTVFNSGTTDLTSCAFDANSGKTVVVYRNNSNNFYGTAKVATVSGTSISFGSTVTFAAVTVSAIASTYESNANKVVICYVDYTNSSHGKAIVGTVSGTSISFGSAATFFSGTAALPAVSFDSNVNKIVVVFQANNAGGQYSVGTVSGTSISFATAVAFNPVSETTYIAISFDSTTNKMIITYRDSTNSNKGVYVVFQNTSSSTNVSSYVGITDQAISSAATGKVVCKGGAITNTGLLPFAPVAGAVATFESASTNYTACAFDSSANKVVIAYSDGGDSNKGTAIVGTVSGSSISFGSPVVFSTAQARYMSVVFDSNAGKIVIAYQNQDNTYGYATVGTISGTSISFGNSVAFETAAARFPSAAFDSTANKIIINYRDDGNSSYGTAIVGTVSGTNISFGTAVVYNSGECEYQSTVYDSNANKTVILYTDSASSYRGTAIIGTVSGTSISFGSEVVFDAGGTISYISGAFDSSQNKVVVAYADGGNSTVATAIVGTVSGTSISFGTKAAISSGPTTFLSSTFDSNQNKVMVAFRADTTQYGSVSAGTVSGTSISFGAEVVFNAGNSPYIGATFDSNLNKTVISFRDTPSTYGKAVVVDLTNALTPNTAYFVQDDGTISTTSSTTKAGTALSTTSLLLTG